jgi:hypothetical protein
VPFPFSLQQCKLPVHNIVEWDENDR